MKNHSETIVVVGFGWVGQANALALVRMGYEVFYYDVLAPSRHYAKEYGTFYGQIKALNDPLEKDDSSTWYMVCIGDRVSDDGTQDISLIERALAMLASAKGKVILRSTILPHFLKNLRFHYYFPEFLHELKAVEECVTPYYFVLGTYTDQPIPHFFKELEERAYHVFKGTPEEAAHIKYLSNIWNAMRIGFVNEFGDSIASPTSNGKRQEIERVLDFIFERKSYLRYGQGFSGHCLPKDLRAYTRLKQEEQRAVPLLSALQESNKKHEEIVRLYQTLPQWFSFWDYRSGHVRTGSMFAHLWRKLNAQKIVKRLRRYLQPVRRATEHFFPNKTVQETKRAWDVWARENAYYYANPDTESGRKVDEFGIRRSGKEDVGTYILSDQFLLGLLGDLNGKTVLEIGSGVGRMTEYLAQIFSTVHAIDISPVMVEVARRRLLSFSNVTLLENDGKTLPIPADKIDLIFSYLTFRHISSRPILEQYVREMARVLKIGGVVKVQLRTGAEVYRWRWFHGISFLEEEARQLFERAGLTVLRIDQENPKSLWVIAKK